MSNKKVSEYRKLIRLLGRKEVLLSKMLEYGFWPDNVPTPYEKKENESEEEFKRRTELKEKLVNVDKEITKYVRKERRLLSEIKKLEKECGEEWDEEKVRKEIIKRIWNESKRRRAERKKKREEEKQRISQVWKDKKAESIVFVGKGYSSFLNKFSFNKKKLFEKDLPLIRTDKELAKILDLKYKRLRFLVYHREVIDVDHYTRYEIPKRNGGKRLIAAPKPSLKKAQRKILDKILYKIPVSDHAHGFLNKRSIITSASAHPNQPALIINVDLEDFFPTVTFERIRGMFHKFGYSGHISTLLAMLCTYCQRIPINIKDKTKYAAVSSRILPQGSPASPMITNIICYKLDKRLNGLAEKVGFKYTRYADDISFSIDKDKNLSLGRFLGLLNMIIKEEGFKLNKNKTRFLRKNNRQSITGIVMNNPELSISRKWIRKLRATIHHAEMFGIDGDIPDDLIQKLGGMVSWVKSVNPKRYEKYIKVAENLIRSKQNQ